MTLNFPWNSESFSFYLIGQFLWYSPGIYFLESKKIDNVAHSFFRDSQFKSSVFLFDSMIFTNNIFNTCLMRLICCSHWPPWSCWIIQSCLNCHTQHLTVLTSTHLSPYTACIQRWMLMGEIFSIVKNSVTAQCLKHTTSQPSILTGIEPGLWIAVGSRFT
jgi:hypothetical protein